METGNICSKLSSSSPLPLSSPFSPLPLSVLSPLPLFLSFFCPFLLFAALLFFSLLFFCTCAGLMFSFASVLGRSQCGHVPEGYAESMCVPWFCVSAHALLSSLSFSFYFSLFSSLFSSFLFFCSLPLSLSLCFSLRAPPMAMKRVCSHAPTVELCCSVLLSLGGRRL